MSELLRSNEVKLQHLLRQTEKSLTKSLTVKRNIEPTLSQIMLQMKRLDTSQLLRNLWYSRTQRSKWSYRLYMSDAFHGLKSTKPKEPKGNIKYQAFN